MVNEETWRVRPRGGLLEEEQTIGLRPRLPGHSARPARLSLYPVPMPEGEDPMLCWVLSGDT